MAAASMLKLAQHYVECTQCQSNAEHYCQQCGDDLCQRCKEGHENSNLGRHHDIVLYRHKQTCAPPIEMCKTHQRLQYDMCCQDCQVPVCTKCIVEDHNGHTFVDTETIWSKKLNECCDKVSKLKNEIRKSRAILANVKEDVAKCKEDASEIRSTMAAKAEEMIEIIKTVLNEGTETVDKFERSSLKELEAQEETIVCHTSFMQGIIDELERLIKAKKPAELILSIKRNPYTDIELQELPKRCKELIFANKQATKEGIVEIFGDIIQSEREREKSRNVLVTKNPYIVEQLNFGISGAEYGNLISLATASTVLVSDWSSEGTRSLIRVDVQGNILEKIELGMRIIDHTFTKCGELFFIHEDEETHAIRMLTTCRNVKEIKKFDDILPISILSSRKADDFFIGFRSKFINKNSGLVRYENGLNEVWTSQYNDIGDPLYNCPLYIAENINGDVWVSDRRMLLVIVLNHDGVYRFSYEGCPDDCGFDPRGISVDGLGNILVCDFERKCIHMIDENGKFLQMLLTNEHLHNCKPRNICLDLENNLFVTHSGITKRCITVYKYFPPQKC